MVCARSAEFPQLGAQTAAQLRQCRDCTAGGTRLSLRVLKGTVHPGRGFEPPFAAFRLPPPTLTTASFMTLTPAPEYTHQFSAILGDLQHKTDVYTTLGFFGPDADRYFSNAAQAAYLREFRPDLLPPGHHNDHTLGTIFEHAYYTSVLFRINYISRLQRRLVGDGR